MFGTDVETNVTHLVSNAASRTGHVIRGNEARRDDA